MVKTTPESKKSEDLMDIRRTIEEERSAMKAEEARKKFAAQKHQLSPCVSCGSKTQLLHISSTLKRAYEIMCNSCGAISVSDITLEDVIKKWDDNYNNVRADRKKIHRKLYNYQIHQKAMDFAAELRSRPNWKIIPKQPGKP